MATFAIILATYLSGYSQDYVPPTNPIDSQLAICLDSSENQTTLGMIVCCNRAEDAWDAELNKYYKLLMDVLPANEKKLLKDAQIKWLAYRDSEFGFTSGMYGRIQGTMYRVEHADRRMEIVKQRAEELRVYYETVKDNL